MGKQSGLARSRRLLRLPPLRALLILVCKERRSSSRVLKIDSDDGEAGQVGSFRVFEAGCGAWTMLDMAQVFVTKHQDLLAEESFPSGPRGFMARDNCSLLAPGFVA